MIWKLEVPVPTILMVVITITFKATVFFRIHINKLSFPIKLKKPPWQPHYIIHMIDHIFFSYENETYNDNKL